jgi:hypothetical protein
VRSETITDVPTHDGYALFAHGQLDWPKEEAHWPEPLRSVGDGSFLGVHGTKYAAPVVCRPRQCGGEYNKHLVVCVRSEIDVAPL